MRKLIVGLMIGLFIVSIPVLAVSEESVFQLTDGYFQIQNHMPHHLVCKPIGKQYLRLEEEFHLWIFWKIKDGQESPCPRRGENFCSLRLEIVGKDLDGKDQIWTLWKWKDSKIDKCSSCDSTVPDLSWSVPGYIPKKAAYGDAKIRVRITDEKGEKNFYSYEIPIEIK